MKELTKAQVQKARRREKRKNAIAQHKAFKNDNPSAYQDGRNKLLGQIVDLVTKPKSKYPQFQFSLIVK